MGLLNLTLTQFLAVLLPIAAGLVALYFYDRSRRRIRVSSLRFWGRRSAPPVAQRQRKIQQPWSLLLQLLAALLLLLAIADFRWGLGDTPRHHAIVLDGSAAMLYRGASGATAMEQARRSALAYLDALPAADPVALIRADASPSVVVGFTADRTRLRQAIENFDAGWTALRLDAALELARTSLYLAIGAPTDGPAPETLGETTYIGASRIEPGSEPPAPPAFLRHIPVNEPGDDIGIVRFAATRSPAEPGLWQVSLEVLNDSGAARPATASVDFAGRRLGERTVQLAPRDSSVVDFRIRTTGSGTLEAELEGDDALPDNNRVALDLPAAPRLETAFLTSRPDAWRALIGANPAIAVVESGATLTVADRNSSSSDAQVWIDPLPADSPVEIVERVNRPRITAWAPGHPVTQGLRETDVRLSAASILAPEPDDVVLVESSAGPVALARVRNNQRQVILGFDLLDPAAAGRLTGPLLFANIVSWFAPETFQSVAVEARPPGVLQLPIGAYADSEIAVDAPGGPDPVWLRHGDDLRLYSSSRGLIRVRTPSQDSRISMTVPVPGRVVWNPPPAVRRGIPDSGAISSVVFWPWMALLAAALLFVEWRLFGDPARQASAPAAGEALS
jgi:hypothetical protein